MYAKYVEQAKLQNSKLENHELDAADDESDPLVQQWIHQQQELKQQLLLTDSLPWQLYKRHSGNCEPIDDDLQQQQHDRNQYLQFIAGADISFVKGDAVNACASLVILKLPDLHIVHKLCRMIQLPCDYRPGFLSFRECPAVLQLLDEARNSWPNESPQALLLDGNGILHPRGFGLASHAGVLANLPTIGCAKSFFSLDGLDERTVRLKSTELFESTGSREYEIVGESGVVHGCAYRPPSANGKPIYISCGHAISLPTAVWLVRNCCRYRVPEPIRQADILSREFLRNS